MTKGHASRKSKRGESGSATEGFSGSVRVRELEGDSGKSDGQGGNMRDGVKVFSARAVMNPKSFLTGILEAGVIAFAFRAKGIGALEGGAGSVDGEAVVIRDSDVFGAAAVLSAVVPVPVIAWTLAGLGISERAAELLTGTTIVGGFAILMHGEASFTKEIANG